MPDHDELRSLYNGRVEARYVLDHFASRERNRSSITVDRLLDHVYQDGHSLSRGQAIEVLRALQGLGFGEFKAGRKGWPSRFETKYGLLSVGRVATGESMDMDAVTTEDLEDNEEDELDQMLDHKYQLRPGFVVTFSLPQNLTRGEATRLADFIKTLPFE